MGTSQVGPAAGRMLLAGGLLAGGMAAVVGLAGCGSTQTSRNTMSSVAPTISPDRNSFSGEPPSALASLASAGQAAVSASAASAAAVASAFSASVSAETARTTAAATAELAKVSGRGNAVAEVGLTGINRSQTGGLQAVVVNITNRSGATASYAVRIDFKDASGKLVDSSVVGAEKLAAGDKAQPIAFSRKAGEAALIPTVAQAQRY